MVKRWPPGTTQTCRLIDIDWWFFKQANITPKPDAGGLVYNLTIDDIQSVFKTYPTVRQKYVANVPHKITESDFWTKFFQSYYFRRDLINTTSNDLFDDCTAKDEEGKMATGLKEEYLGSEASWRVI